jgi:hypothetical protein
VAANSYYSDWHGNVSIIGSSNGSVEVLNEGSTFNRNFQVRSGSGDDRVQMRNSSLHRGNVVLELRNGADRVLLEAGTIFTKRFTARLGNGDDYFNAGNVTFQNAFNIDLGAGNDLGAISRTQLTRPGVINGGRNSDTFGISDVTPNVRITVRSVEGGYGF